MIWIGIDPGAKGAMAFIGNYITEVIPYEPRIYIERLKGLKAADECICCIEDVHSLPREGVTSAHRFGRTIGWLYGVLDTIGIPYQPIKPQRWKAEFGLNSDKATSIEVCKRLFPDLSLLRTERSRKEDDNLAEAMLMALYAKRKF